MSGASLAFQRVGNVGYVLVDVDGDADERPRSYEALGYEDKRSCLDVVLVEEERHESHDYARGEQYCCHGVLDFLLSVLCHTSLNLSSTIFHHPLEVGSSAVA